MKLLEQIDDSIWLAKGEMVNFYGFPYPTRSVIVRLTSGDIWVWSPVKLRPELRAELDRLGPIRHLVSPNKIHHLYLHEWKVAYPDAKIWGPESTIQKRPDLHFDVPLGDIVPAEWQTDLDVAWFKGSFAMDEVVFYHRSSRTVIVADLIEAFGDEFLRKYWPGWRRWVAYLGGITAEDPCAPLDWRLSFFNRKQARVARTRMCGWPCARVIMAHGEWQRTGGDAYLRRAFSWLGP